MIKKTILMLLVLVGGVVSANADDPVGTATTVYYAVPSNVVGSYNVKINVNFKGDGNDWHQYSMTKTEDTFLGYVIYSCEFTDAYNGVGNMQFQLYNGDSWVSQKEPISSWTAVDNYNGKMYVHDKGWATYIVDDANLKITYHVQATNTWTPIKAYEYNGEVNTGWTGKNTTANPWNNGWYDYVVTNPYEYIIFNDNNSGNGHQTGNIKIDNSSDEYWITYTVNGDDGTTTSIAKPENWMDDYQRTGLTAGNLGTICLPFNATLEGATVYKIVSKVVDNQQNLTGIYLEQVTTLEAGKAYIFEATASTITATTSGEYTDAEDANGMLGNLSSEKLSVPVGNYVIGSDNLIHPAGAHVVVGQYKAYITLNGIDPAVSQSPYFIGVDDATGIEGLEIENSQNDIYDMQGRQVKDVKKGLFIINGKKVLVK